MNLFYFQELYAYFCTTLPTCRHTCEPTALSPLCLEYLSSVLLTEPITGHYILSYLFHSQPDANTQQYNDKLHTLELQCLQVLLTELINSCKEFDETNQPEIKNLCSRFSDLLALFNPVTTANALLENFIGNLVAFLYSSDSENLLSKSQVLSCLLGRKNPFLLQLFFKAESVLRESHYEGGTSDIQLGCSLGFSSSHERIIHRDRLFIGLSQHKNRTEAWNDLFFYCYKCEKHFLELFVVC
jgi:hypothetical protein